MLAPGRERHFASPGFVRDVVAAGATRVSVLRAIGDATDPERAASNLRAALGSG